jgi:hypothetical protein
METLPSRGFARTGCLFSAKVVPQSNQHAVDFRDPLIELPPCLFFEESQFATDFQQGVYLAAGSHGRVDELDEFRCPLPRRPLRKISQN